MSVHSEPWPGIGLLVLVTLAATACSGAGSTVSAGPPATASARPTAAEPPVVISADVRTGEATVDISGTLEATLDLTAVVWPNVFSPPPGGMAITWRDLRGDLFGIGGRSFTGSRKTTGSLILSLAVKVKGGFVDLSSTHGECTITIDEADAAGVEGSFDCANLGNDAQRIDATGTFAASP